jgi:hypothetical protein
MKKKKCLTSTCDKIGYYAKGLCNRCYQRIWRRIKCNQFKDWEEVIEKGIENAAIHTECYYYNKIMKDKK